MATIAQIRADLVGSSAVFRSEMLAGQRQANESLRAIQTQVRATADSVKLLNTAAAGFIGFEGLKNVVGQLLEAQKAAQQIHYTLLSATGSSSAASDAYSQIEATADRLGLSLQSTAQEFAQMSAAATANGVSMRDQMELFNGVARSATVLHLSSEQSGSAILALSQMFSKGKIQAQELQLQLGQAIPGVVPRFQQAVLEMTKGTELAGKSFQQLLEGGDLTVNRFMPALIQALNQTGRGAEEASHGLNAELNRLSTAWFKLKADLSTGLFSDATVASVRLLSDNLSHLVDVAGVAGGLTAARFAGIGLGKAADGAGAAIAQQQQARAAAQAAAEVAAANAASADAQIRNTQVALESVVATRQQALAAREAAGAAMYKAQGELAAAEATLAHVRSAATLSANIRAERDALAQAAAAQATLNRAQVQYDGAVAASNSLKQQQIALETRLMEAKAASAAGTEAQILAERELAASTVGAMATRGLQGLGNFALSLVGGPWGAAVATLGALGYAIYSVKKESEQWRAETDEQVKTLQQLREQVKQAADDYGRLHAAMGVAQTLDVYAKSSDDLASKRKELADLLEQQRQIEASMGERGGGGMLAGLHLDEVKDRIRALQDQLPPAQQAVDELGTKLAGSLAPSLDAVKGAIDRLRAGASLQDLMAGWSSDIDNGIKALDASRQKVQQLQSQMQADAQKLSAEAATDGMNNVQKQQYALRQALAQIKAQRLAPDQERSQVAEVSQAAAAAIQAAAQKDAADQAKKGAEAAVAAAKRQQEAYDSVVRSITERIAQDKEAASSDDKLTAAEKLRVQVLNDISSGHLKLSTTQRSYVDQLLKEAVAQGDATRAAEEHKKQLEAMAVVQENIDRIQKEYSQQNSDTLAGMSRGSQYAQDAAGLRQIQRQYDQLMSQTGRQLAKGEINKDTYDQEIAQYKAALDEQLKAQQDFYAARDVMEGDWLVGAQRALDDYRVTVRDVASQTATAFSDSFRTLEDDLTQTFENGKFKADDFVNSIIASLARIPARALSSGIANLVGNAIGSYFSGGSGSGSFTSLGGDTSYLGNTYNTGSLSSGFNFGGGRASGGPTTAGTLYEVAEGGAPELYHVGARTYLLSGQNGFVQPAGAGAGGGSAPVAGAMAAGGALTVNIYNNQGDKVDATAQQSRDKNGLPQLDVFIDSVEKRMASNVAQGRGPMTSAIAGRFGLNRGANT